MMHCVKYARRNNTLALFNLVQKNAYSRRSDKNTDSYKLVRSNNESVDDVDGAVLGTNSNWELLTPSGFRFYLPGSVGPGWLDATTTAQALQYKENQLENASFEATGDKSKASSGSHKEIQRMVHCVAQECPILLRKGIEELFPGCMDVSLPQLTIVTISQKTNCKSRRWSKEVETEKLAKYFVLAASDICHKLKVIGFWADFINPFSGQPHLSPQKKSSLYKTDKRFRCLGFKIEQRNHCKIISYNSNAKTFIGSLYTTAPASTDFLREIMSACDLTSMENNS